MPREDNRSLRRLLLTHELAFLVLVAVAGAVGAVSAHFWRESSEESIRLNELAYEVQELRSDALQQLNEVALARLREDPEADAIFANYSRSIKERFNVLRQRSVSKDEAYAIQELQQAYGLLREEMNRVFGDAVLLNRMVRSRIIDPAYMDNITGGFRSAFENFRGLLNQKLGGQQQRIAKWSKIAPYLISIPLITAVILLLFSRFSLMQGFVRPMQDMVRGMKRLADEGAIEQMDEHRGVSEVVSLAIGINAMNREVLASRDALIEKERQAALGNLVPVVAHNIRNPLASIRATVQVLDATDSEADVEETKRTIIETVDRLGRWVTALVSYLHPLTPQYREHKVSSLFAATEGLLRDRIQAQHCAVIREPWDDEVTVWVDADLMEQALYSLLSNALDASPKGAALTLGIASEENAVIITISDQAGGIPFQPEPKELEPGPTTKRLGTGLGIPIAFKVCKAHGWELQFDINKGIGTTAIITASKISAKH